MSILMQALASKQDRHASGDGEVKNAIYLPICMEYDLNGARENGGKISGNVPSGATQMLRKATLWPEDAQRGRLGVGALSDRSL
jgi:hypothetical protein